MRYSETNGVPLRSLRGDAIEPAWPLAWDRLTTAECLMDYCVNDNVANNDEWVAS